MAAVHLHTTQRRFATLGLPYIGLTLVGVALLGGCTPPAAKSPARTRGQPAITISDRVASPVVTRDELNSPKRRIVCAAPVITEICCALGLREQLVGRTRYCTYPPGIESVPSIGALIDLNVETLLDLKPDLLLVSGHSRAITDRLRELQIPFETLPDASLADIYSSIERVGELTGRPKTAADVVRQIKGDVAAVAKHFADVPRARVLLLLEPLSNPPSPPFVAGGSSFYGELLTLGQHISIVDFSDRPFAPLSLEYIVNNSPEAILELDPEGKRAAPADESAARVWSQIGPMRAVERKRIHVVAGSQHLLPGPRVAFTMYALLDALAASKDN